MKWQITDSIVMRKLTLADAKHIFPVVDRNRDYLREWLPWVDFNTSVFDSRDFIRDALVGYQTGESLHLSLWANNEQDYIGICGFYTIKSGVAKLGYWVDETWQRNGIITAACQRCIDFAFDELGLNEVIISAATGNIASQNVATKLNMQHKETVKNDEWLYDHYVDHEIYSIFKP